MRFCRVPLIFFLSVGFLPAQSSTNTITVTVSQNASSQPDEALFNLTVASGVNQGLNDVVSALTGVGITSSDLTGLGYSPTPSPRLQWQFQLAVPLSSVKATATALAALAKNISQSNSALSLSFSVSGSQNSGAQTQSCNFAALMSSAQVQAQSLASAAGYIVGRVLAISSTTSQGVGACTATVKFGVGNPTTHAIEITSSRTVTSVPDQVVISITVNTTVNGGLDDVTSLLAQAGFSAATFASVYQYSYGTPPTPYLEWSFTLTIPLTALAKALAPPLNPTAGGPIFPFIPSTPILSVSIAGLSTSQQSQPACPQAALIADATAQAQALASAAGGSAGAIDGISAPAPAQTAIYAFIPEVLVGSFSNFAYVPAPTACLLLVQSPLY
jgi:uncharacterized protein YggE